MHWYCFGFVCPLDGMEVGSKNCRASSGIFKSQKKFSSETVSHLVGDSSQIGISVCIINFFNT